MNYEIVQQHEYQDIYRLTYGVLLKINKFKESEQLWSWTDSKYHKNILIKVNDLIKCYKLNEDVITRFYKEKISKDTIIFEDRIILPTNNKNEFYYELKTTGSCFGGNLKEFQDLLNMAESILKLY